ncbi:phosphatidylethanolamine-binding protein [Aspergillus recurvatus]
MRFFVSSPQFSAWVLLVGLRFTAASTPSDFEPEVANDLAMVYADDTYVHAGVTLSENTTVNVPALYLPFGKSTGARYAAVMVDYDVNVYGTEMTILQWYQPSLAAVSSSGDALSVVDASAPSASYISLSPIEGSAHEYVVLLYLQPADFSLPECLRSSALPETGRAGFNLDEFVQAAGLGDPVAANWFKMQNPTSATTTYAVTQDVDGKLRLCLCLGIGTDSAETFWIETSSDRSAI